MQCTVARQKSIHSLDHPGIGECNTHKKRTAELGRQKPQEWNHNENTKAARNLLSLYEAMKQINQSPMNVSKGCIASMMMMMVVMGFVL
jgi:hypothetical protein